MLRQPSGLSINEVQRLLDSDTVLLEYSLGEERSYGWAITSASVTSFELPPGNEIELLARELYEVITKGYLPVSFETAKQQQARLLRIEEKYKNLSAKLSQLLIGPVASQLGKKRLLIVADGMLQYLPFAALPELSILVGTVKQAQPLIVNHEIISLPSASTLDILRREHESSITPKKTIAVFADPVMDQHDSRVRNAKAQASGLRISSSKQSGKSLVTRGFEGKGEPHFQRLLSTEWEASKIISLVPKDQVLEARGFDASKEMATDPRLSEYRLLHFATHGMLDSKYPELSGMVLSLVDKDGQPKDGFLRLNEIYDLNLPGTELVVLSACETGLGKDIKGEGQIGLTGGFMYAGAQRIMTSLWRVDDRATAELMVAFYRKMLLENKRPSAALREAQIKMWRNRRWKEPYFWAGFIIQGDWRQSRSQLESLEKIP